MKSADVIHPVTVETAKLKYASPFAYSMTYDEGTIDCLANAYPVHEEFGWPGHVNVVAGQLGKPRNCFRSSLNGYLHMGVRELRTLIDSGWGIGNHSWSHFVYPCQPGLDMYREIVWSRYHLEDEIERPVRIFALCNDAYNYEPMIDLVRESHMACIANCFPSPNATDLDIYEIGNMRLSSAPYPLRPSWPIENTTERITLGQVEGHWLLDTTHLCMWDVPQPHKCVTPADLRRRFEKLDEISGGRVWAATPDEVVDYLLVSRGMGPELASAEAGKVEIRIDGNWPVGIVCNELTLIVRGVGRITSATVRGTDDSPPGIRKAPERVDSDKIGPIEGDGAAWTVTAPVAPGVVVELETT